MSDLFKTIHEQVRIELAIQNIERNIAIGYTNSTLAFFLALCILGVTMTMDVAESANFYIVGWGVSGLGFCLAGYLVIGAYRIKEKLNILLEKMAQDK